MPTWRSPGSLDDCGPHGSFVSETEPGMSFVVNKTVALFRPKKNRLNPSYHHQQAPHPQPARVSPHRLACILEICSVCHSRFDFLEAGHSQGLNYILFNNIVAFNNLPFVFNNIVALMCSLLFLNDLVNASVRLHWGPRLLRRATYCHASLLPARPCP